MSRILYILSLLPTFYVTILSDLDGPEAESQGMRDFSHPSREAPIPTQPPVQWVARLFLGVEADRAVVDHLLLSSTQIRERVQDRYIGC
jgi:hypothetical protein